MVKRTLKYLGIFALAVFMVALTACGNESKAPRDKQQVDNRMESKNDLRKQNLQVSFKDAVQEFQKKHPDTPITQFKLEHDDGRYIYNIEGKKARTEYEMEIDAKSKEILQDNQEKADKDDNSRYSKVIDFEKIITPKEAMAAAVKEKKGDVSSYEIDTSYGKPIYKINLQSGNQEHEITVQGTDGKVIQVERD